MLKKIIQKLEDPEKPLFGPNFWILKRVGLILPENKIGRFIYIFLHELVTLFVISQYVEVYFVRSDFNLVLTNLKISMLSIVCVVKSNTFILWQDKWNDVINYVTEADMWERQNRDHVRGKIIDRYTRYCRKLLDFYWVLLVITAGTVIITPLLRYISSSSYRAALRNGTEPFPHIFSAWTPIDKYNSPGSWITVAMHTFFCIEGAGIMASYDTCALVLMVFFGGKLDLLKIRCKQIFDGKYNDADIHAKIKELHQVHVLLMKYSRIFDSLLSPVMFFYVVICSLMLCVSAFELTSATDTMQFVITAEYLTFGIAQLFMYCWHSNDVLVKSIDVSTGPYESEWWSASLTHRKYILTLAGQLRIVHIFHAGPFTNLTLATFITILKGAYSYYTLLK